MCIRLLSLVYPFAVSIPNVSCLSLKAKYISSIFTLSRTLSLAGRRRGWGGGVCGDAGKRRRKNRKGGGREQQPEAFVGVPALLTGCGWIDGWMNTRTAELPSPRRLSRRTLVAGGGGGWLLRECWGCFLFCHLLSPSLGFPPSPSHFLYCLSVRCGISIVVRIRSMLLRVCVLPSRFAPCLSSSFCIIT